MAYAPNSNVASVQDSVNGNWTYGYDDFNRLISSNKNSGQQTYSYLYDRFGNRWQQNAPQGGSAFVATFSGGNNRIDSATHDLSGNVTKDPTTGANYTFDAENRITTVNGGAGSGGVTYTYDADSQRVEKNVNGVKTDYVYDLGGHAIAEISGSGTLNRQELFSGGKHLGTYTNSTTYFSHGDWLGSERVRSDMTGAPCETIQNLPFGDGQSTSGNCGDPSTRHFTGKERDTETNLDYFGARYYGSSMGQFISADWSDIPEPVPYADFRDPQSLDLYSYVRGLPTTKADADGHCWTGFQHLCNWVKYEAWSNDKNLNGALEKKAQADLKQMRQWNIKIVDDKGKTQTSDEYFQGKSNQEIVDGFGEIEYGRNNFEAGTQPVVPMLGARGTQVTSKTLWSKDGARIDVENPNPGQRPGQIHYQDGTGKYIYDVQNRAFQGMSATQNRNLLSNPDVQKAIQKGLQYLGAGQ